MSAWEVIALFVAGVWAGTINTVVGSGTLVTFPVLLAFGYAPVIANVSNTVGLIPGAASGGLGYRPELAGQRRRMVPLIGASLVGGIIGAVLLLTLPAAAFKAIVPVFIAAAVLLIIVQPRLSSLLSGRRAGGRERVGLLATLGVLGGGVYGGYFGAAQGIMVLAILSLALDDDLQRLNAVKVVLTGLVNLVSGVVFILVAHIAWAPAGVIAVGSLIGGIIGARVGRRLSPSVMRATVVVVGTVAVVRLVM